MYHSMVQMASLNSEHGATVVNYSNILAPDGLSNRKYHYYWLTTNFSALRCGEYKMVLTAMP